MSLCAYPMIEKKFEGHMWSRMSSDASFYITGDNNEMRFLNGIGILHWLSDECSGYTETCIDSIEEELKYMRPEERYRIKDLVYAIKEDIKNNDGWYIQYNVG